MAISTFSADDIRETIQQITSLYALKDKLMKKELPNNEFSHCELDIDNLQKPFTMLDNFDYTILPFKLGDDLLELLRLVSDIYLKVINYYPSNSGETLRSFADKFDNVYPKLFFFFFTTTSDKDSDVSNKIIEIIKPIKTD